MMKTSVVHPLRVLPRSCHLSTRISQHRFFSSAWSLLPGTTTTCCSDIAAIQALCCPRQSRSYSSLGSGWIRNRVQYTKYRICKPWSNSSTYDDILLSEPSREDLVRYTKEVPLFLRFCKLLTDIEGRQSAFLAFAKRCENGLVVEKDVYLTKSQLVDCMWKNGYSNKELNAFEISFPNDYHFHYPELSVLFDISEEDTYKYCLRRRAESPEELVELKYKKPGNLLSSYGLAFLGVWFGLGNTSFSNAWFYSKTFPFGAVIYLLGTYFYRDIREYLWKEDNFLIALAHEKTRESEDLLCTQIQKYANDAKCYDYLNSFKAEVQSRLVAHQQALNASFRGKLNETMFNRLTAMSQAEQSMAVSLQEVMVLACIDSFKKTFNASKQLQNDVTDDAIAALAGDFKRDTIGYHLKSSLKSLQSGNISDTPGNPSGTVKERVSFMLNAKEKEFLDQFSVRKEEANEVMKLVKQCKTGDKYEFDKLSPKDVLRLEALYKSINDRMGIYTPHESMVQPLQFLDVNSSPVFDAVNKEIDCLKANIRQRRLTAFANAFT